MKGLDSFAIKASENMKITKLVFFSKYVTFTSLATDVVWIAPEIFSPQFLFNKVFKNGDFYLLSPTNGKPN